MEIEVTEEQAAAYNAIYERALALVRPNILIDGEPQSGPPGWLTRRRLREGIRLFEQALAIAPFKWECRFWTGKALQRLGDHQRAFSWFVESRRQARDNHSVAKEAANAALEIGNFPAGISFLRDAIQLRPSDSALHYDLAIHLLLSGQPVESLESLQTAERLESHPHTIRLSQYVEQVLASKQPCPRSLAELRRDISGSHS